jgi:hypothetical protein
MRRAVLGVALATMVAPAWAKPARDPVAEKVRVARSLLKSGSTEAAIGALADAIVRAQKDGSPHEQEAVDLLDATVEGLPTETIPSDTKARPVFGQRQALFFVLAKLDAKRRSAFVSAPALARTLLCQATLHGDGAFVTQAATVLEPEAKAPKAGRAAVAIARYARGAAEASAGRAAAATAPLEEALALAKKEGWSELAVFVGAELAAAYVVAGDLARARAALATAVDGLDPKTHAAFELGRLAGGRLASLPKEVLDAIPAAIPRDAKWKDARGGAGGPPEWVDPGDLTASDAGKAFVAHPKAKPLVRVQRTAEGWTVRPGLGAAAETKRARTEAVDYHAEGGVTVAFQGDDLALYMVDLSGRRGGPGGGNSRPLARAFYLLGTGETYSVAKDGLVTIE